jgi:hypothetical protein
VRVRGMLDKQKAFDDLIQQPGELIHINHDVLQNLRDHLSHG